MYVCSHEVLVPCRSRDYSCAHAYMHISRDYICDLVCVCPSVGSCVRVCMCISRDYSCVYSSIHVHTWPATSTALI